MLRQVLAHIQQIPRVGQNIQLLPAMGVPCYSQVNLPEGGDVPAVTAGAGSLPVFN